VRGGDAVKGKNDTGGKERPWAELLFAMRGAQQASVRLDTVS